VGSLFFFCFGLFHWANTLFVLPNTGPKDYLDGSFISVRVNKLTSVHTQLPYDYYSLPFPKSNTTLTIPENLGELLAGDKWMSAPYSIVVGEDKCAVLGTSEYNQEEVGQFIDKVKYEYLHNWQLDGLPAAVPKVLQDSDGKTQEVYSPGFPLGKFAPGEDGSKTGPYYLNNHVDMTIKYHEDESLYKGKRIIGFEVIPSSKQYDDTNQPHCSPTEGGTQLQLAIPAEGKTLKVLWTYQVKWESTDRVWSD